MMPPRSVLAAIDFSPGSRVALGFASRLASQCGAALHVLHAVPPAVVQAGRAAGHDVRDEMLDEVRKVLAEAAPAVVQSAHCHVIEGEVASVILDIAARENADLIVLGGKGLSNADWPALGSTLEEILRRTTISVLVVPGGWQAPVADGHDLSGIGPVIAGIDMTCPAIEAAAAACRLALPLDTTVLMLHAVPLPQTVGRWQTFATTAASTEFEHSKVDFERVAAAVRAQSPVAIAFGTECGDVGEVLAQQARAHPHAIVVLGRAGSHSYHTPGALVARALVLGRVPVLMHVDGVRS